MTGLNHRYASWCRLTSLPARRATNSRYVCAHHTAAERGKRTDNKINPKPESKPRIAYAEGRVKPLARLLRCATALRVTAPHGCGSGVQVCPKGSLSGRPHGPNAPLLDVVR